MINSRIVLIFAFFIFLICTREASADKIILENGDILTGTIEKVVEGKLTLKTEYSGPIEIQVVKIKKIFTDNPVEVHLASGEILKGKIKTLEDGGWVVEKSIERETTTVDREKVASINPPQPKKWSGNINLGGNLQTGNTDRAGAFIAGEVMRKTERDRLKLRYQFNYTEEEDKVTTRNHYGMSKYDYFFTKKLYGYLGIELMNDKLEDLNLRTIVGPGVGYQIWDDPIKSLLFEAGLTYTNQNRIEGEDEDWVSARLAGDFSYKILDFVIASDQLTFYPSLGHGGEYLLRNEAALTTPLGSRWALKFSNIIKHDSDPPQRVKKNDIYWILSLQYSF